MLSGADRKVKVLETGNISIPTFSLNVDSNLKKEKNYGDL
jgi:hypothetical protein